MTQLVLVGRLIFGAWMLLSGANYFFLGLYPLPAGDTPLAVQLMTAMVNSELINVVMAIQLIAGALILAGICVPVALTVLMPISICAAYWAVVLNQEPLGAALALAAVALNGLLMLAYVEYYRDVLQRRALASPESTGANFEARYVDAGGRTSQSEFIAALVVLLAAAAFYYFVVPSLLVRWILPVLLFPAFVLHARRLHDMGRSSWLLLVPGALIPAAIWLGTADAGSTAQSAITLAAAAVVAGFVLWGVAGKGEATGWSNQ